MADLAQRIEAELANIDGVLGLDFGWACVHNAIRKSRASAGILVCWCRVSPLAVQKVLSS
jgi:hypothetical protein